MNYSRLSTGQTAEAILDASPDALVLVDFEGRIAFANDRVSDLLGYDPDELVGSTVERLVPEDVRDSHVTEREAFVENPRTRPMGASIDLTARRKDGTTVPVDITLSPIELEGECYVIAVVRDISEQEAFRTKYRTILQAVPDAVVVADATTGVVVEANEQVTALTGHEPEELVGEPQTVLHPTGEEQRYSDLFEKHVDGDETIIDQMPDGSNVAVETTEGETVPVEINAHTFELQESYLAVGVFRDVTTRKERERALERLNEASRSLMSATDTESVAAIASETVTQVLDLPINAVLLYDSQTNALVPDAWSDAAESMFEDAPPSIPAGDGLGWQAYDDGEAVSYADVRDTDHVLNEETPVRSELDLPLGEHGLLVVASTTADDFDAADEALAQVLAANVEAALDRVEREEELRRQNERLNEFASIVSHDLRNPLNVAQGQLQLANEQLESDRLDAVERAHDRMAELIEDLLALARNGETEPDTESVELGAVVDRCWSTVETGTATLVNDADGVVRADKSRLQQLLENLVRNATEHSGGDPTVTVGTLDGGFYVADDGPGIPDEEREQVFDAGYSTADEGTGFGLAIVGQIAHSHGWDVTVTDAADGGARFEFTGVDCER